MVIVQGEATVHPDDMPAFREAVAAVIPPTRAEAGCLFYTFAEDLQQPGQIYAVEHWADDAAIDAHFKTAHLAAFFATLASLRVTDVRVVARGVSGERVLVA